MKFALINSKREVLEVKNEQFQSNNPAFEIVKIHDFEEGDELNYYIVVNVLSKPSGEKGQLREAISYSAVRQTAIVARIRMDNEKLQRDNANLMLKLAEKGVL